MSVLKPDIKLKYLSAQYGLMHPEVNRVQQHLCGNLTKLAL